MKERVSVVPVEGPLGWRGFDIPDGTQPVELAQLRFDSATRATTSMVRFPQGWERPSAGSYTSAEEFVVLEGELRLNGERFAAGEWVYVPKGAIRRDTAAESHVLAFAWFDGPAFWLPGAGDDTAVLRGSVHEVGAHMPSPFGGASSARLLRNGGRESAWMIDAVPEGAHTTFDAELFDLSARVWAWVPAGATLPPLAGPAFCRTFMFGRYPGED
jgi:hypothetical protein